MTSLRVAYAKDIHGKYQDLLAVLDADPSDIDRRLRRLQRGIFFEPQRPARKFGVSPEALKTKPVKRRSMLDFVSKRGVKVELQAEVANWCGRFVLHPFCAGGCAPVMVCEGAGWRGELSWPFRDVVLWLML